LLLNPSYVKIFHICYPTPSERWGRGGTPRRLNSRTTPRSGPEVKNGRSRTKVGAQKIVFFVFFFRYRTTWLYFCW